MDLDEILIFNPNKCLHRAGIPVQGNERTNLCCSSMFQAIGHLIVI